MKQEQYFFKFLFIWFGQLLSLIGSKITLIGIGFWVLKDTESIFSFSIFFIATTIPAIIISPFAGVIVDRFKRKQILILSDSMSSVCTAIILLLLYTGQFELWHIYITGAISAMFGTFQSPAYNSTIPLLVPKKMLARANGLNQLSNAIGIIIAPLVAGALFFTSGLKPLIIIDLATFLFAIITLAIIKLPELKRDPNVEPLTANVFFKNISYGFIYLSKRAGLIWLLLLFAVTNLLIGSFDLLITPYILANTDNKTIIGIYFAIIGSAMVLGGILIGILGAPKKRIKWLIMISSISGLFLALSGVSSNIIYITLMLCLGFMTLPIINAISTTIFQSKVEPHVQGRVFSLIGMVAMSLSPISYAFVGPLAEYVFEPMMVDGGRLATTVGSVIGTGEGRGIGLMFIIIGLLWSLSSLLFYLHPRLRNLETEIQDVKTEDDLKPVNDDSTIGEAISV
ncbi:MFS transporter [Haloplasma contractile]|uniref:Macrolide-efflux protein n=1 Tax=Haloplasma contractile SSD-17B TaxID=1033810 RepID=U2FL46_9MOLU|nr:MFS transporter [Haloplasma contractile]ERJ11929.1 Macrolide-efflux protein [Haloplasma contractile SSD-17B]